MSITTNPYSIKGSPEWPFLLAILTFWYSATIVPEGVTVRKKRCKLGHFKSNFRIVTGARKGSEEDSFLVKKTLEKHVEKIFKQSFALLTHLLACLHPSILTSRGATSHWNI